MPAPVDYRPPPRPARSVGTWLMLICVWIVGLVMWAVYAAVLVMLLFKVL